MEAEAEMAANRHDFGEMEAEAILFYTMWKRKPLKTKFEIWKQKQRILKKNLYFQSESESYEKFKWKR